MTEKTDAPEIEKFTDFNDLHRKLGLPEVRAQIEAVLQQESPESPAPSDNLAASPEFEFLEQITLEGALQRFAWTIPDGAILDLHGHALLKPAKLKGWLGTEVYNEWIKHPDRRAIQHKAVLHAVPPKEEGGGGLAMALERFVLIYPSQNVWDSVRIEEVPIADLKLYLGPWFTPWLNHPERRTINRDQLQFDPTGKSGSGIINKFKGLPLKPRNSPRDCEGIRRLVYHLCNDDQTAAEWLFCWMAYPLQNVGAKLTSAILMHSETNGSGKSWLFEKVLKAIYGDYGATLGQHQIESQYTDWKINKLFALFEEVLSRDQKYSHTGTIKHMITGQTHRIEKKFMSGWEEFNHVNAVFLSNELQPWPLDPSDRRMMVIWPNEKLRGDLQIKVDDEISNKHGVEAFYGWLLKRPLTWTDVNGELREFDIYAPPPMTEAKMRLIDFGRPSWDLFHRDWRSGSLEWPYETVLAADLYRAYEQWCKVANERCMRRQQFTIAIAARERRRVDMDYKVGVQKRKGVFFIVEGCPEGMKSYEWLGGVVERWQNYFESP
jgi:putative DNA primase/helicase